MQLILPFVFKCACPDCDEWVGKEYLVMFWYEIPYYYSHIRCKLVHHRIKIGEINIGD